MTPGANPNLRRRGSAPESTQNPNLRRRGSAPETEGTETSQSPSSTASAANSANAPGNASGQTSQARGYTATHPTTSTQTRSTARPHVHHIAATQFPGKQHVSLSQLSYLIITFSYRAFLQLINF